MMAAQKADRPCAKASLNTNTSGSKVALYPYALVARKGEVPTSNTYLLHEGPIGVFDGTLHDGYKYDELKADGPTFPSTHER